MNKYAKFNEATKEELCKFNDEICCNDFTNCARCGWNPDEAKRRHNATLQRARLAAENKIHNPETR